MLNVFKDFRQIIQPFEPISMNFDSFSFEPESVSQVLDPKPFIPDAHVLDIKAAERRVHEAGIQIALPTIFVVPKEEYKKTPITKTPPYFREFGTITRIDTSKPLLFDSKMHIIADNDSYIDPFLAHADSNQLIAPSESQDKFSVSKFFNSSKSEEKQFNNFEEKVLKVLYTNFSKEDVEKLKMIESQTKQ